MKTIIIYNPNSTGNGEANARALAARLRKAGREVSVHKTTHPGHGEEIAARMAKSDEEAVLISSSGDGGYHEVVNGALAHESSKLIVGVLPSGNANDHATALGSDSLSDAIINNHFEHIDTIKVTSSIDGKPWVRYAHSYVGLGVTPMAAKTLTEERPNAVTEKLIVARSLFSFSYVKILVRGDGKRYSSILFGNIDRMSKVLKISENSSVKDGKFEMSSIRFHSKLRLILYLLTAATVGLKKSRSIKKYEFDTIRAIPIQIDGEVFMLDSHSHVKVESVRQNLHCVL